MCSGCILVFAWMTVWQDMGLHAEVDRFWGDVFFFCNGLPCKLCDPGVYMVQWLSVYRSLKNSEAAM